MKRIAFRGDDAGSSVTANEAIVRCLEVGVLKNVSVMAPGPALADFADRIGGQDVCLGLHVTLNSEWDDVKWRPCAETRLIPSLLDNGEFTQHPGVLHERGFDLDEAMVEVRAQLALMREVGLPPKYLDEHMGVGWLPGLRDRLLELCIEEGLATWAGFTYLEPPSPLTPLALLEKIGDAHADPLLFVTHPGGDTAEMRRYMHGGLAPGQIARERQADTDLLTHSALAIAMEQEQFRSVRLDEIRSHAHP